MPTTPDDPFGLVLGLVAVPTMLASARDGIDALYGVGDRRARPTPDLTSEALLRGAAASAELAGSRSDLAALRLGDADPLAAAAARLNAGLLALVPVVQRSPLEALARMHTMAAAGLAPADELGRPRPGGASADALHDLARRLTAPTRAPAVAVAAIAHAEVLSCSPFSVASDLVARALERLLLVARGVDPTSVTVPEVGHRAMRHDYEEALDGFDGADPARVSRWLRYWCTAFVGSLDASPLRT